MRGPYVPVQRGDVFIAGDVLAALTYAVTENELGGAASAILTQVPDTCR